MRIAIALLLTLVLTSCAPVRGGLSVQARRIVAQMSPRQRVRQVVMTGIAGAGKPSNSTLSALRELEPGAVILFGFNVAGGPAALREFTSALQAALPPSAAPILFAIDHEGGKVWRFSDDLTRLPAAAAAGAVLKEKDIRTLGGIAGRELRALGIGLSLGPVVEPLSPLNRDFMEGRCYSDTPGRAALLAAAFARGLESEGLGACYKHYPASAAADPHRGPSRLSASAKELRRWGLEPFTRALRRTEPVSVMLSHAVVEALDPDRPASLSPAVTARLRASGFSGLILTDDLLMAGARGDGGLGQAALTALNSGADMVMLSSPREAGAAARFLSQALEDGRLEAGRLEKSCVRIIRAKLELGLWREKDPAFRASSMEGFDDLVAAGRNFVLKAMRKAEN